MSDFRSTIFHLLSLCPVPWALCELRMKKKKTRVVMLASFVSIECNEQIRDFPVTLKLLEKFKAKYWSRLLKRGAKCDSCRVKSTC